MVPSMVFFEFFMIFLKNRKSDLEKSPSVYGRLAGADTIGRFARKVVTDADRTLALLEVGLLTKRRRGAIILLFPLRVAGSNSL